MDRQQVLGKLGKAWAELRASYHGMPDRQLEQPGVMGDWSVKDCLGHVAAWEEEALKYLPMILEGKRPPRYRDMYGGIDAFNARTAEAKRGLPLAAVLSQLDQTHARLIVYVQSVPEDQFMQDTRFRRRLRADTYGHYPIHARAIEDWRKQQVPDSPPPSSPKGAGR